MNKRLKSLLTDPEDVQPGFSDLFGPSYITYISISKTRPKNRAVTTKKMCFFDPIAEPLIKMDVFGAVLSLQQNIKRAP